MYTTAQSRPAVAVTLAELGPTTRTPSVTCFSANLVLHSWPGKLAYRCHQYSICAMAPYGYAWLARLTLLFSAASASVLTQDQLNAVDTSRFDYVILGGGTAGLVVASRLSEDPKVTVAVIEAGDFEKNNANVTNATTPGATHGTALDWQYVSAPQVYMGNQSVIWRAGKGLGGSSLINGMFCDSYVNYDAQGTA